MSATDTTADQGRVSEQTSKVADQAREQVQDTTRAARGRLQEEVDRRTTEAGDRVHSQAGDLRAIGEQLRGQGNDGAAGLADEVAARAERAGDWLREADADTIVEQAEDLARRNPWALFAGAAIAGLALSRVVRAGSAQRAQTRTQASMTPSTPPMTPPTAATTEMPPARRFAREPV